MEEPWPFILPLPKRTTEQYKVLASAFSSEIAFGLLKKLHSDKKTYQKSLIKQLAGYSTKSILKYLKRFVEAGILKEGVERATVSGRTVWVKWYMPTFVGKWLILLLTPREELPSTQIKKAARDLLSFYAESIAKLCVNYNLNPEYFKELFDKALTSTISTLKV
jgi:hypothetical protein